MTSIPARPRRFRWLLIAAGCLATLVTTAAAVAPQALATPHEQIAVARQPTIAPVPPVTAAPTSAQASATALGRRIEAAIEALSPGTTVGIDVVDTRTGSTLAGLDTDQQFYTASVVKLLIAIDDLESQGTQPDSDATNRISEMLSASDDDIADQLWDADGGDAIVTRMADLIGLTDTAPPLDPAQWGETLMSPRDVVKVFGYITTTLPEPDRDLVMNALSGATRISADGTDQYFGIPDGLGGDAWAIKQGWMALDSSTTLDTTGLVGADPNMPLRYAVVILTTQPADTSWDTGVSALTAGVALLHTVIS
ncbi:hypothetical protein [Nocardia jejuensis]|uniref:hypothetical protein n=1 Tax=Nocardia jejuensis TaxID=328049 RepID=UPI000B2BBBF5|nr:hypothetical protein [Nocardia jejuensis]